MKVPMGIFSKLFGTKDSTLKDACICMIEIDSDSYELIIVSLDVYKKISAIAKNNGYSIITL
jgi:hypothetical protein